MIQIILRHFGLTDCGNNGNKFITIITKEYNEKLFVVLLQAVAMLNNLHAVYQREDWDQVPVRKSGIILVACHLQGFIIKRTTCPFLLIDNLAYIIQNGRCLQSGQGRWNYNKGNRSFFILFS